MKKLTKCFIKKKYTMFYKSYDNILRYLLNMNKLKTSLLFYFLIKKKQLTLNWYDKAKITKF